MRHQKSGRRFNRDTDSRKALMRNLCTSLLESGRITTTEAKAKEMRRWVERLITTAKGQDLNARRAVAQEISKPGGGERRRGRRNPYRSPKLTSKYQSRAGVRRERLCRLAAAGEGPHRRS